MISVPPVTVPRAAALPPPRTVVIARRFGQLGNRLILFAHWIAYSRQHGVQLLNPSFVEYAPYFPTTSQDLWCRYPPRKGGRPVPAWLRSWLYHGVYLTVRLLTHLRCTAFPVRIIRRREDEPCDLDGAAFQTLVQGRRLVCVQGWRFRTRRHLLQQADAIRAYFRPAPEHELAVEQLTTAARTGTDCLVGVHIRHGDYATFCGGRYYYQLLQYHDVMQRIQRLLAPRRVRFLVCSNVPPPASAFGGCDVRTGSGHLVEDLYALARCDYLVGPPSTFTTWASFYGEVPLCHLETAEQELSLASFHSHAYRFQGTGSWSYWS